MNDSAPSRTPPRRAAWRIDVVEALADRIRDGRLAPGDKLPTEAAFMAEFGVSRTVVREAMSKLQASALVETRHGVGTFVVGTGDSAVFRIRADQLATLRDVVAMLELRIGVETEAAGLAAQRRTAENLARCATRSTRSPKRSRPGATRWALTSSSIWRSRARPRTRISRA